MGMFDTIKFHPMDAPLCHAGHQMLSLQTKDLECKLATYLVYDGVLHLLKAIEPFGINGVAYEYDYAQMRKDDEGLILVRETRATPVDWGSNLHTLHIYNTCFECKPILSQGQYGFDNVDEKRVWVEFDLGLRGNRVESLKLSNGDRDAQLKQLQRQGAQVFDDDHPIAVAHRYRLEQERKRQNNEW